MSKPIKAITLPNPVVFRWLPKFMNHIAENIVFKKRNISFFSIIVKTAYSENDNNE